MWIALSLLSAVGAAGTTLCLKRAVDGGSVLLSTVAFRVVAGVLLLGAVLAQGPWPAPSAAYWRALALVIPPEVAGMLCLSLALRAGDVSLVQPLLGLLPLMVTAAGVVFLDEIPTAGAAAGIVLVTAGVYCVGLGGGRSLLDPFRALARDRASWFAVGAAAFWSLATMMHKVGIDAVGPLPWGVTLSLGSAIALAPAIPMQWWRSGRVGRPARTRPWLVTVALAGVLFAVHQAGLHLSLGVAQAGYVIAVSSTSTLLATVLGIVLLRERTAAGHRIAGGVLVSAGAALIAIFG